MNELGAHLRAATAVFRRDLQLFVSYRVRFITSVLGVFFSLTLFFYISKLVRVETFPTPEAYYAFVVVGLVILQVLNSTLQSPPTLVRQELVAGTFERLVLSPFGPIRGLAAMLLFPFLFALVLGFVMLAIGSILYGLDLRWSTAPLAVPVAVLGAMAFMPFGILLLAVALVVKQAAAGTTWIVAGISIIAGLYFPVALLPDWIEWASDLQPFTPAVNLLRNVLVGTPLPDPLASDLLRLVGFAVVTLPAATWALQRAVRLSQRTGTIIEY